MLISINSYSGSVHKLELVPLKEFAEIKPVIHLDLSINDR